MAVVKVILAKLSPTMEEGTIVKWSKNEGDAVKSGDVLAEIETDKANMEMEALGSGVLRKILVPAGGKAPVGALIGVIANPDEDISKVLATASAPAAAPPAPAAPPTSEPAAAAPAPPAPPAQPAAPPPQPQPAAAAQAPAPPPVAPAASAAPAPAGDGGRVKASPLARSMAAQQNIPLGSVPGSGPGGRIIKRDIEAWSQGGHAPAAGAAPAAAPAAPAVQPGQQIPLSGMRKTIARRLSESAVQSPHFYVTVEIAMEGAAALREQVQKAEDTKVSYNDIILKACAKALRRFPAVNASWQGESIAVHGDVHIGVAVAINDGLIVPVVRHADRKSLLEVSRATASSSPRSSRAAPSASPTWACTT